ncbi:MAG: hypothetical protein FJX68_15695 [Alphaproteobacteria bacterium]|nr:hypothetical protein [Alphaproteobacteria bacterium]
MRAAPDFAVEIVGIDADASATGRLLCDHFAVLPMADEAPERYLSELLELHRAAPFDVYLGLSDAEARWSSRHRSALLSAGIRPAAGDWTSVEPMTDKLLMLDRLVARGLDAGEFFAVESRQDAEAALRQLGHPVRRVVLKPRRGRGSRGVLVVDAGEKTFRKLLPDRFCGTGDWPALTAAMANQGMDWTDMVAMPYYDGPVFDLDCIAVAGRMTDVAVRLRQLKNPFWPTSTGHKIAMEPRVVTYAGQLCAAFGVDGAGDFDVVLANGERPLLFDSSARFSGSVGETFVAGANLPAQLVRTLAGMRRRDEVLRDGLVMRPYITMAPIPAANEWDLL